MKCQIISSGFSPAFIKYCLHSRDHQEWFSPKLLEKFAVSEQSVTSNLAGYPAAKPFLNVQSHCILIA
jgi:hypothetical protein